MYYFRFSSLLWSSFTDQTKILGDVDSSGITQENWTDSIRTAYNQQATACNQQANICGIADHQTLL